MLMMPQQKPMKAASSAPGLESNHRNPSTPVRWESLPATLQPLRSTRNSIKAPHHWRTSTQVSIQESSQHREEDSEPAPQQQHCDPIDLSAPRSSQLWPPSMLARSEQEESPALTQWRSASFATKWLIKAVSQHSRHSLPNKSCRLKQWLQSRLVFWKLNLCKPTRSNNSYKMRLLYKSSIRRKPNNS